MTRTQKLLVSVIALVLIAAVAAWGYSYQAQQQERAKAVTALLENGIAQFHQSQYTAALETLNGIAEDAIQDWRLPYYKGVTLVRLKDYQAAAVALEQARILNSEEESIPFALGVVYFKQGNLGLSKSYFNSVLEINPSHKDAKGLMDIMAKIERMQTDAPTDTKASDKEQPPAQSTPAIEAEDDSKQ